MARATVLMKITMILISMNIVLYASGVRVIGQTGTTRDTLEEFVDINNINKSENRTVTTDEEIKDKTRPNLQESGSSNQLSFVDSLGTVTSFLVFIPNIILTPIGLFTETAMPIEITLVFGVPILVMGILAVVYFFRSGK